MKLIHCLFSIYLILISSLPCADLGISNQLSNSSQEITSSITDKHSQDTNDNCSPFCVCNCCGSSVFVYNPHYNFSSFKNSLLDVKVPEYRSVFASNYSGSIWQPPQINS